MRMLVSLLSLVVLLIGCKKDPTEPEAPVPSVTWEATSLDSGRVSSLCEYKTVVLAAVLGAGVYRSTDNGTSWAMVDGLPHVSWAAFGKTETALFLYIAGMRDGCCGSVFSSVDSGRTWTQRSTPDEFNGVQCFADGGSDILAGSNGVYRSTDGAETWFRLAPDTISVSSLAVIGARLFAGTEDDLLISDDGGTHWTNAGLEMGISSLAVSGTTLFAGAYVGGRGDATGGLRSTDLGSTWKSILLGLPDWSFWGFSVDGPDIVAGVGVDIWLSTDSGTQWTKAYSGSPTGGITSIAFRGKTIFAGTDLGVLRGTIH